MNDFIIGQILGGIATILFFISFQVFEKKKLLLIQSVAIVFLCGNFLFLHAPSGLYLNVVCLTRNFLFYFQKPKTKVCYITTAILSAVMVIAGALSWQGWVSLPMIIALTANTVFMSFGDPQLLRKSVLVTSPLALLYNTLVLSFGGAILEISGITASIVGIIRYNRKLKRDAQTATASEVTE